MAIGKCDNLSALRTYVGLLALACLTVGCSDSTGSSVMAPPKPPTPEEQFAMIVETIETRLNDPSLGDASAVSEYGAEPGTPVTNAKVRVQHALIQPEQTEGTYRATLSFFLEDPKVTVVLPLPTDEERAEAKAKHAARVAELKSELGDENTPDIEALVVPPAEAVSDRLGGSPIHEIEPEETSKTYEFEHREGQWVPVTQPDEDNEPFYALLIKFALAKQQ